MFRRPQKIPHSVEDPFFMKCHFHIGGIKYHSRSKAQCVAFLKEKE